MTSGAMPALEALEDYVHDRRAFCEYAGSYEALEQDGCVI